MSPLLFIASPPASSVGFFPNDDDNDGDGDARNIVDVDVTNRDNIDKAELPTAVCRIK